MLNFKYMLIEILEVMLNNGIIKLYKYVNLYYIQ